MADSTSRFLDETDDEQPGTSRKRTKRDTPGGGGFGNRRQGVKGGYGNVVPMQVRNKFNKGGQVVPYTIKCQKYLEADITHNQNPFNIPYQTLTFWTGL